MPDYRAWWDRLSIEQRTLVISGTVVATCAALVVIALLYRRREALTMRGIGADLPDLLAQAEQLGRRLNADGP